MDSELMTERRNNVCVVTINRPHRRNALSVSVSNALSALWKTIDDDDDVRAVVLTSADCGTFCAGMDLKEAAELNATGKDVLSFFDDPYQSAMLACRKPVVVAMTGDFLAGGMMLALNADLRVGMAGTVGGITEARIGRGSPWGVPLVWMLPQAILSQLVLCGEPLSVEAFKKHGFVNAIEDTPEAVRARAMVYADVIAANAPLSVLAGKQMIRLGMNLGYEAALQAADEIYQPVYASRDAAEGPRAFAARRQPVWSGL